MSIICSYKGGRHQDLFASEYLFHVVKDSNTKPGWGGGAAGTTGCRSLSRFFSDCRWHL